MRNAELFKEEGGADSMRGRKKAKGVVVCLSRIPQAKHDSADYITAVMSIFHPHHSYIHLYCDICKRDTAAIQ